MRQEVKRVAGPLGLGVAACAACCAGPVLGVIGGLSLAGSAVALGLGATLVAVLLVAVAVVVLAVRRRRRQQASACATRIALDEPVAAPVVRTRSPAP
jgi:mercuric ion transport protein